MKKIFYTLMCVVGLGFLSACDSEPNIIDLSADEIYFFYQETCPHCHTAAQYIKNKYPHLNINKRNIKLPGNMALFKDAVATYNIRSAAGTPLICFGEHYIMGWGPKDREVFDYYAQPYLQK